MHSEDEDSPSARNEDLRSLALQESYSTSTPKDNENYGSIAPVPAMPHRRVARKEFEGSLAVAEALANLI